MATHTLGRGDVRSAPPRFICAQRWPLSRAGRAGRGCPAAPGRVHCSRCPTRFHRRVHGVRATVEARLADTGSAGGGRGGERQDAEGDGTR
eukprot:gene38363-10191_t